MMQEIILVHPLEWAMKMTDKEFVNSFSANLGFEISGKVVGKIGDKYIVVSSDAEIPSSVGVFWSKE